MIFKGLTLFVYLPYFNRFIFEYICNKKMPMNKNFDQAYPRNPKDTFQDTFFGQI